jgi:hypothetical protein
MEDRDAARLTATTPPPSATSRRVVSFDSISGPVAASTPESCTDETDLDFSEFVQHGSILSRDSGIATRYRPFHSSVPPPPAAAENSTPVISNIKS